VGGGLSPGPQAGRVGGTLSGPGKSPDARTQPPGTAGPGGFSGWVNATYTVPATGKYVLKFVVSNLIDDIFPSALVVGNVSLFSVSACTFDAGLPAGWVGQGNFGTQGTAADIDPTCGPNFAFLDTNLKG